MVRFEKACQPWPRDGRRVPGARGTEHRRQPPPEPAETPHEHALRLAAEHASVCGPPNRKRREHLQTILKSKRRRLGGSAPREPLPQPGERERRRSQHEKNTSWSRSPSAESVKTREVFVDDPDAVTSDPKKPFELIEHLKSRVEHQHDVTPRGPKDPQMGSMIAAVQRDLSQDETQQTLGLCQLPKGDLVMLCSCGGWVHVRRLKQGLRCHCGMPWSIIYYPKARIADLQDEAEWAEDRASVGPREASRGSRAEIPPENENRQEPSRHSERADRRG